VYFPVVPLLDVTFQLLAFFIMTYQPATHEGRLDLILPVQGVVALSGLGEEGGTNDLGLETDVLVRVKAFEDGGVEWIELGEARMRDAAELEERLRRYGALIRPSVLRMRLWADEGLRYEESVRVIAASSRAGVEFVRIVGGAGLSGG
jgi:biopolymer transport protein ExbD